MASIMCLRQRTLKGFGTVSALQKTTTMKLRGPGPCDFAQGDSHAAQGDSHAAQGDSHAAQGDGVAQGDAAERGGVQVRGLRSWPSSSFTVRCWLLSNCRQVSSKTCSSALKPGPATIDSDACWD